VGIVKDNLDEDWDFDELSKNSNITWDIIEANPGRPWDFRYLSKRPNITWDIIEANPDALWDFDELLKHPNMTWDIIEAIPDEPWDFESLSINPNITWDIVKANPDKPWNFGWLSANPMFIAKKNYTEKVKKALNVISDWVFKLKTDPAGYLCKKWMKQVQPDFYDEGKMKLYLLETQQKLSISI
jgi:hypothetical protein